MNIKLTAMEKRAKAFCDEIKQRGHVDFAVLWKKSATWGSCPSITYRGCKIAHASGCGYDKLSAVLHHALKFLSDDWTHCGGHGESAVIEECKRHGWALKCVYDGNMEKGYTLERITTGEGVKV